MFPPLPGRPQVRHAADLRRSPRPLPARGSRDERVHPLVRQVCRIHVADEARHISFARSALRDSVRHMPSARLAVQRQRMGIRAVAVTKLLVNSRVYRDMGLDPRVARSETRANAHFRETLRWSGAKVVPFLLPSRRAEHRPCQCHGRSPAPRTRRWCRAQHHRRRIFQLHPTPRHSEGRRQAPGRRRTPARSPSPPG
ncbi:diiron oxygenase [Streptomyces erythrochromogenes]|uniref:diiron oxygenase n=1 Tax=Streptomyces erythrochromogenes TaxID=285574 RepID=UPI00338D5D79